jgi:geranyl-CoA carboxylase alpha subunit
VAAALAVGYCGAGTIEFILDAQFNHYFLEMNTRLQVEHPVTEMITGFDLVAWQIQIAAGRPLPVQQADVQLSGHAIEVRLCAEDPYAGFAPQTGTICRWRPQEAMQPGIRIDDGIVEGCVVSPFYDPLVAKIIAHGHDRDDAIRRLRAALAKTPLLGVRNNGQFLSDVLNSSQFRDSAMTTATLDQWMENDEPLLRRPQPDDDVWCLAAAVFAMQVPAGDRWRSLIRPVFAVR